MIGRGIRDSQYGLVAAGAILEIILMLVTYQYVFNPACWMEQATWWLFKEKANAAPTTSSCCCTRCTKPTVAPSAIAPEEYV